MYMGDMHMYVRPVTNHDHDGKQDGKLTKNKTHERARTLPAMNGTIVCDGCAAPMPVPAEVYHPSYATKQQSWHEKDYQGQGPPHVQRNMRKAVQCANVTVVADHHESGDCEEDKRDEAEQTRSDFRTLMIFMCSFGGFDERLCQCRFSCDSSSMWVVRMHAIIDRRMRRSDRGVLRQWLHLHGLCGPHGPILR
jgi:hypothetical protein